MEFLPESVLSGFKLVMKRLYEGNKQMTHRSIVIGILAGLGALTSSPLMAQVTPNGFRVRHEVSIAAPPAKVYDTLVNQVGKWCSSDHTFSGDSNNLSIDAKPGGCFCERFPKGGGVEHLRIIYVSPGELLRMSGALGPLQDSGLAGSLTWKFTGAANGTKVELSYVVGGYLEGGFDQIAPIVQRVLAEQLERLKRFIETGKPQ